MANISVNKPLYIKELKSAANIIRSMGHRRAAALLRGCIVDTEHNIDITSHIIKEAVKEREALAIAREYNEASSYLKSHGLRHASAELKKAGSYVKNYTLTAEIIENDLAAQWQTRKSDKNPSHWRKQCSAAQTDPTIA